MARKSRIIMNITGYTILFLSLAFIIYSLRKIDLNFLFAEIDLPFILLLIPVSILYSGIFLVLAFNFSVIISAIHKEKKINPFILPNYLKANIGKYLPTNLFHFAGRHILISNLGYENKKILSANIIEFFILIFVSFILLLTGILFGSIRIPQAALEMINQNLILIFFAGSILLIVITIVFIKFKKKKFITSATSLLSGFHPVTILLLILAYSLFFILTGSILYMILTYLSGKSLIINDCLYSIFSFSVCWQIGFISPGVPGGIGVREALLLLFFSGPYGETVAFYSGVVLRLITISGDVIAFLYAFIVNKIIKNFRVPG